MRVEVHQPRRLQNFWADQTLGSATHAGDPVSAGGPSGTPAEKPAKLATLPSACLSAMVNTFSASHRRALAVADEVAARFNPHVGREDLVGALAELAKRNPKAQGAELEAKVTREVAKVQWVLPDANATDVATDLAANGWEHSVRAFAMPPGNPGHGRRTASHVPRGMHL